MVTVNELGRPEFALQWDEAAAVVAETAAVLLARGLTSVPDAASIVLAPDGELHLLGEGPPSPAPAQRLGGMLDTLLASAACPAELRGVIAASMANPPAYATVEQFAAALAFFERPGRRELLMGVAARASEAALQARANTELERLEARARNQPPKTEARPDQAPAHKNRFVLVFTGSVLLVGIAAGVLVGLRATGSNAATLTERVRTRVDRIASKGLEAIGLRTPAAPPATTPDVAAPPSVARKPARRAPRELPVTISVKELAAVPVAPSSSTIAPEAAAPLAHDEAIYTNDAENVEPAVLMRPHLPTRPPSHLTSEEIGVLEIIVSVTGAVEQVRLVSTSNRFQDRMIVAAAKAWQFEPAMKDGQAVRYRTRIRITL